MAKGRNVDNSSKKRCRAWSPVSDSFTQFLSLQMPPHIRKKKGHSA